VFHQVAHQHFADAGARAVRVDRQAPQAATVFRVSEGFLMVEAHHAADHRAAVFVLGQPIHRAARVAGRQALGVDRQHAASLVELVDRLPIGRGLDASNTEATKHAGRRTIVREPQAQGVGRVEEQLLRIDPEDLLGRRHVQCDVALAGLLVEQFLGQAGRVGKRVADQQPAPAAMHRDRLGGQWAAVFGQARLQALVGRRLAFEQALAVSRCERFH